MTDVVIAATAVGDGDDLRSYLDSKRDVLSEIATPDQIDLEAPTWPRLWIKKGGWGSPIDWAERMEEVCAKTPLWLDLFHDLPDRRRHVVLLSDEEVAAFLESHAEFTSGTAEEDAAS